MAGKIRHLPARAAKKTKLRPNFKPLNNLGTKSLLLDLPAELRNNVYYYIARSVRSIILLGSKAVSPPLAQVNRQVQRELLSLVAANGVNPDSSIQASINDFDFRKVVTFLNKNLKVRKPDKGGTCDLQIAITMTDPKAFRPINVRRWVNRCASTLLAVTRSYSVKIN